MKMILGSSVLSFDPNTAIHAAGRGFVDRGYVGKIQAIYRMPSAFGGVELASVADYMDGLAFARQLLVTGLPQGPFLVATTVRGKSGGWQPRAVCDQLESPAQSSVPTLS